MDENLDLLLFDKFKYIGRCMRMGRASGMIYPCECSGGGEFPPDIPAFQREIILAMLSEYSGSMRQKDIAQEIRVSPSTLSEMINKLEADGYVKRSTAPDDRRATLLTLTDSGKLRAEEIKSKAGRFFAHVFRNLNDDDKRQLISLLDKIAAD